MTTIPWHYRQTDGQFALAIPRSAVLHAVKNKIKHAKYNSLPVGIWHLPAWAAVYNQFIAKINNKTKDLTLSASREQSCMILSISPLFLLAINDLSWPIRFCASARSCRSISAASSYSCLSCIDHHIFIIMYSSEMVVNKSQLLTIQESLANANVKSATAVHVWRHMTSIGTTVAKLWPFLYVQDGRQPPSWILSNRK